MASFQLTIKRKKSTRPNSINTIVTVSKFLTLLIIETIVHKNKEVIYLNIEN